MEGGLLAKISGRYPDELNMGRWFVWYPEGGEHEWIRDLKKPPRRLSKLNIYKAEMKFQWKEEPVPPEEESETYQGGFIVWTASRKEALEALHAEEKKVKEAEGGEVLEARIYKVDVKITPMKDVVINLLNKKGIEGKSHLAWERSGGHANNVLIGGAD